MKTILQKNFLVPGEILLETRSHRMFGNTLLKAGHLMRSSVCQALCGVSPSGQGLAAPIQNNSGLPRLPVLSRQLQRAVSCILRGSAGPGGVACST